MNPPELNQFAPPRTEVGDVIDASGHGTLKLFSAQGRIGRLRYLAYTTAAFSIHAVCTAVVTALAGRNGVGAEAVLALPSFAAAVWFTTITGIKRCHDMNLSGWWVITSVIPVAGLIWLFNPGSSSTNRYGPPPPANTAGVRLLGLLPPGIALVGMLAAVAIPAYQGYAHKARQIQQQVPRSPS